MIKAKEGSNRNFSALPAELTQHRNQISAMELGEGFEPTTTRLKDEVTV